jgi:nicotinamidase-related amidase
MAPGGDYDDPILQVRGRHMMPRIKEVVATARRLGVKVVAATDTGYDAESTLTLQHEIEMLTECGLDEALGKDILLPLIKSTITNLETQTPPRALTGSFARADVEAFERHMTAMEKATPAAVRYIYLLLGERSLDLAAANGADPEGLRKLRESISIAKRKSE